MQPLLVFENQSHPVGHVWSSLAKESDSATDDNDDFSVVVGKKRRRLLTAEAKTLRTTLGNDESGSNHGSIPPARTLRLVGTASGASILQAAKDLTKKEIFCISNVVNELGCDDIVTYVKFIKVRVISCFVAKTRIPDTKAFRICIDKADRRSILDKGNWP